MPDQPLPESPSAGGCLLALKKLLEDFLKKKPQGTPSLGFQVARPEDLLHLQIELVNFQVLRPGGGPPQLFAGANPNSRSYLLLTFPPQHLAEEAFYESAAGTQASPYQLLVAQSVVDGLDQPPGAPLTDDLRAALAQQCQAFFSPQATYEPVAAGDRWQILDEGDCYDLYRSAGQPQPGQVLLDFNPLAAFPLAAVRSLISGRSRLVFDAGSLAGTDFTLEAVPQAARTLPLVAPGPGIAEPEIYATSLEAPYRLVLAPQAGAAWEHAPQAVASPPGVQPAQDWRWSELWHTRLTAAGGAEGGPVRAVWTRDPGFSPADPGAVPRHSNQPFRMPLDAADRHNLVHLTANEGQAERMVYEDVFEP